MKRGMKENAVKDKSFAFALRIVKLYQFLSEEKKPMKVNIGLIFWNNPVSLKQRGIFQ